MTRTEVESNLEFVGFIVFENKLKPTTSGVIEELQNSNIGTVMVTGDNILTAISVARECTLLPRNAHCFVPHFIQGMSGPDSETRAKSYLSSLAQATPVIRQLCFSGRASITAHYVWIILH